MTELVGGLKQTDLGQLTVIRTAPFRSIWISIPIAQCLLPNPIYGLIKGERLWSFVSLTSILYDSGLVILLNNV